MINTENPRDPQKWVEPAAAKWLNAAIDKAKRIGYYGQVGLVIHSQNGVITHLSGPEEQTMKPPK